MAASKKSALSDPPPEALAIEQNNATGQIIFWQKEANQSESDSNGVSLSYYIHALYGLLRQAKSRDVLMIGCGGGTLATMLRRLRVNCTIVDIDARAFEISRRYFNMPDDIECHVTDGLQFLRNTQARYDAIVLDAYTDGIIPKQFRTTAFFALAKSRLRARNGILLANVWIADKDSPILQQVIRPIAQTWRDVRILDEPDCDDRNAIVAAGTIRKLKRARLLMKPLRDAEKLAAELKLMAFRDADTPRR